MMAGRFACFDCGVELSPVRIGLWRCASCHRFGPLNVDSPFAVLTFSCTSVAQIERAHQIDTARAVRVAIEDHEPLVVP